MNYIKWVRIVVGVVLIVIGIVTFFIPIIHWIFIFAGLFVLGIKKERVKLWFRAIRKRVGL